MTDKYILVDRVPVREPNLLTWARWFETSELQRLVRETHLKRCTVTTWFTSLDQRHHRVEGKEPVLFTTIVEGGPWDGEETRGGHTWEAAEQMHQLMIDLVSGEKPVEIDIETTG